MKCNPLPMKVEGGRHVMQVSIEVTEEIRREAESRGLPIIDYVELLIAKGREAAEHGTAVTSAIECIRALRAASAGTTR
jgi:hypothetical protein